MIKEALFKLLKKENLSFIQTKEVFAEIFNGQALPTQVAAFLALLSAKKESAEEIWAAASFVRQQAIKIKVRQDLVGIENSAEPVLDTCGTGGSGVNKFNISTANAFVVASANIKVAKHGNRAMSSHCGSMDVLEELGIKIDVPPQVMAEAIKKIGIGFLYAPLYHPALAKVAQIRRELGIRTIFNILGPLCNPAEANYQLLGVCRKELVRIIATVLKNLGTTSAFVVYSEDLKDEISLSKKTWVSYLHHKKIENLTLSASSFGLKKISPAALKVKDAKESASLIKGVFSNQRGPARDIVLASCACCFYILKKVKSLKEGVALAGQLLASGKVKEKYQALKDFLESCHA